MLSRQGLSRIPGAVSVSRECRSAEKTAKIPQNHVPTGILQKNRRKICKTMFREGILRNNRQKFRKTMFREGILRNNRRKFRKTMFRQAFCRKTGDYSAKSRSG
ncbi:MAG: hypothetical protein IJU63_07270 [Bacteroidales bacterium]|nr:hypothetical protein [Bacteroidales bacterium]